MPTNALRGTLAIALASALATACMLAHTPHVPVDVNVRWGSGVSDTDRLSAERRFGLVGGELRDGTTWHYLLRDHSAGNVRALVTDPRVDDTHNLNRETFRPVDTPWNTTAFALQGLALGTLATLLALATSRVGSAPRFWSVLALAWGGLTVRAATGAPTTSIAMTPALILAWAAAVRWSDPATRLWLERTVLVRWMTRWAAKPRYVITTVCLLTVAVLVATAADQIYDAQHFLLTPATSILAGDRPYVDFFESGVPLGSYMAAAMLRLSGGRLIGEFVRQWLFIVAGVALAFHLGLRLSRSVAATLSTLPLTLLVLAVTPTYHESKLFFFPLMLWAAWRYIQDPTMGRAAAVALVTALGFLSRHDYGVYLGVASICAFLVARLGTPTSRGPRAMFRECAVYAAVVAAVLAPWAVAVQAGEGLVDYTRARLALNQPAPRGYFLRWMAVSPARLLLPEPRPAPRTAVVSFRWRDVVDESRRQALEQAFHLRVVAGPDDERRWKYELPDLYNPSLFDLDREINDGAGFDWDRLRDIRDGFPPRDNALIWLMEMGMLVPVALMVGAIGGVWAARRQASPVPLDVWQAMFAATFVGALELWLLREPSYIKVVAPLAAALSARFLVSGRWLVRAVAVTALLVTTYVAATLARHSSVFAAPTAVARSTQQAFTRLTAAPPQYDDTLTYLRECTIPGDRLLVTGNTPLHVSYYAQRPIAGGHLMWHYGWLSDAAHEARSLALLDAQSVPFAFSTSDPVRDDFGKYPRISAHLRQHYAEVDGTEGRLLVDTRRQSVRRYGPRELPCFR